MHQSNGDSPVGKCRSCGQPALLPATLDLMVVCPKCGTEARASDLVLPPTNLATPPTAKALDPEFVNAPTILAMPDRGAAEGGVAGPAKRDWLAALDQLNRFLGGRRRILLTTLSLIGGAAPIVDAISGNHRPWFTIASANMLLFGLWLCLFTWLTSLRDDNGSWKGRLVFTRLHIAWSAFWETVAELRELALAERLAVTAASLLGSGSIALAALSMMVLTKTVMDPDFEGITSLQLSWWVAASCVVAALALWFWAQIVRRRRGSAGRASGKIGEKADPLPAFVDLQAASLPPLRQELLLRVFLTLSKWSQRRRRHYDDTSAYQAALARHFRRHARDLAVRREVWLGKTRAEGVADLILAHSLVLTVRKGFAAPTAESTFQHQIRLQQSCPTKRKLLLVFDTDPRALQQSPAIAALGRLHTQARTTVLRIS
ncbi:MAG: hypothetical protein ACM3ZE_19990 [Myxococcales bacterium]